MWLEMRLKRKHIHILIIILLCAIIYSNTFFSGFVFDDKFFIQDNFRIRSLSNIPSFFRVPGTGNLYRPIRETLYSITFFFWGLNPFGYHMNAVLLHTLISVLAYLIIFQVTGDRRLSLIASLLFAAHPIHTARVANMTAGFDLLGILFLFWSFYLFTLFRRKGSGRYLAYSLIVFTLGLFSSEEAAMLPLLALWYDACFIGGKGVFGRSPARYLKKKARQFWPFIAPLGIYIFARFFVLRQIGRAEVYFLGSLRTRVFSTMVIFLRYIYIMAFPLNLTVSYDVKQYSSLFSLGMLLALLAYALIIFFWLKLRRSDKPAFFSVGWFFIALIPFSNIFPVHTFMADRYLYSASFGFALFSACIIFDVLSIRADKRTLKAAFMVIAVFLIVSYSALAIARNREWKSDDELLSRAVERQPESSTAHNDLGQAYENEGLYSKALYEYRSAISLNPRNHVAWLNLGSLYGSMGNYSPAIYCINRSLGIFESYKAHNNLGLVYDMAGENDKAVAELKKAIGFNPSLTKAYMDLGVSYAKAGNLDMAFLELDKALELNPHIPDIHYNLGVLYDIIGEKSKAEEEFNIAYGLESGSDR